MGGKQRNQIQEDAFAARYDSKAGRRLRTKKEGAPMIGRATAHDEFIKYMSGDSGSKFRDLPHIAAMRERAAAGKAKMNVRETPEQLARRLRRGR